MRKNYEKVIRLGGRGEAHAHSLIAETAKAMAHAVYERLAHNNEWYKANPDEHKYVMCSWGLYIEQARQTLAGILTSSAMDIEQKEQIYEALILDKSLRRGRAPGSRVQVKLH